MTHPHMIITILNWERRLEFEEEKRKLRRSEDGFSGLLVKSQPAHEKTLSILNRLLHPNHPHRLVHSCQPHQNCVEM